MKVRMPHQDSGACKVCGGRSHLCGVVDFERSSGDFRAGRRPRVSGTAIYYRRCDDCGFLFTNAFDDWTQDEYRTYIYNEGYIETDPDFADARPRDLASRFLNHVGSFKSEISVLDYGGGTGLFAQLLRSAGLKSAAVYDPFTPEFSARPTGSFLAITCMEVIEHVAQPMSAVREMSSLLKLDGFVRVNTTEVNPDWTDEEAMRWWYLGPRNGHISMFTRRATELAWNSVGMRVRFLSNYEYVAFRPGASYAEKLYR